VSDRSLDGLHEAVTEIAGQDVTLGEINRITEELHRAGVRAWCIRKLLKAGVTVSLGAPDASEPKSWFIACQRWATTCRRCSAEVGRGVLVNLGRLPSGEWAVECAECRPLDAHGERAQEACKKALLKELDGGDAEDLLSKMLDHAPDHSAREMVEDLMMVVVAAQEG
jgi:hypothetical protein